MSKNRPMVNLLVALIIIAAAVYGAFLLVKQKRPPVRRKAVHTGVPVYAVRAEKKVIPIHIYSTGTVIPRLETEIVPQVSGKIVWVSPKFREGGFFDKGETFFKIEKADYEFILQKAKARLAKARLDLELMEAKAQVARREWMLQNRTQAEPPPLVLMKPQLENARAQVESARAEVEKAELDIERTRLKAPFNCVVLDEQVDTGHYVRAGTAVGSIAGTDTAEIKASISLRDLEWITFKSGKSGNGEISRAKIALDSSFDPARLGWVTRSSGRVEEKTRLTYVFVEIPDPYQLRSEERGKAGPALPFGSFVHVSIAGKSVTGFPLPSDALKEGDNIFVVSKGSRLEIRHVRPFREDRHQIVLLDGLSEGELVVVSPLPGAAPGMKLRVMEAAPAR